MNALSLKQVTKQYGKSRGVSDITLDMPAGTIFGFLGPNGAGKSTTINMLINLTRPTSGEIKILDKNALTEGIEIRKDIGFLASDMSLDGHLSGWQQLEYFGALRGYFDKQYVQELARRLDCNLGRKIKTLSRGNRQKVALIAALMHKPELLILDEPTSGLDPLIQAEFNKIILEHRAAGRSTFISSHVLSEIQELCDHVSFIRQGKLVATMTMEELLKAAPKRVRIASKDRKLPTSIKKLAGVDNIQASEVGCSFGFTGDSNQLLTLLAKHKIADLTIENSDLEQTFMTYYEDDNRVENA